MSDDAVPSDVSPAARRALLELATDPLWVLDEQRRFAVVNEAFLDLVGYDRQRLLGESMRTALHAEDAGELDRRLELLVSEAGTDAETWVGRLQSETGSEIPVELEFSVAEGDRTTVVGLARDVRKGERQGQKLNILNRALRHNIRNQMNVVVGHARNLQGVEDEGYRTEAETIEAIGNSVVNMSDKARRAQKHATIPPDEDCRTDLVPATETVVTKLEITHPGASVETDLPDAALARAPTAYEVALMELLENAVVHHPSGTGPVDVAVDVSDEEVTVRVRDQCDPVPEGVVDALRRGEETPLEHNEGLGLWIVTWIADPVDGRLAFDRRPDGEGNDVSLTFDRIVE